MFEIDSVEISAEELLEQGLTESQRNRVILLARELDRELPRESDPALCIVDADFDYILDRLEENRFLAYTDGTSLDLYAFTEDALERVLRLGFRDFGTDARQIFSNLFDILKEIFILRAANESLGLSLSSLPFERRCKVETDGTIRFDCTKYIREYLATNRVLDRLPVFLACMDRLRDQCLGARERWVRGHDFEKLVTRYLRSVIRSTSARKFISGDTVVRMLFVGLNRGQLAQQPLFQRISSFLRD